MSGYLESFLAETWRQLTVDLPRKPGLDLFGKDLPMIGAGVVGWTLLHLAFTHLFARPISKYWVVASSPKSKKEEAKNPKSSTAQPSGPSKKDYQKYETAAWKAFVYSSMFSFGLYALWNEPYFLSNAAFAQVWPKAFPPKVEMYYILTMSQYVHASIVIFWQPKQSDFIEMMIHHIATLFLLGFSYVSAWYEIGTRLIIITDTADPLMEIAKCWLYGGYPGIADIMFAAFAVVFILTRVIAFPFYCIIPSINYRYVNNGGPVPFWNFNFFWVLTLYAIFLFWTYLILKMALAMFIKGDKDRQDIRDIDDEEHEKKQK